MDKEGKTVRVLSSGPTFNVTTSTDLEVELLYMLAEEKSELIKLIREIIKTEQTDPVWPDEMPTRTTNTTGYPQGTYRPSTSHIDSGPTGTDAFPLGQTPSDQKRRQRLKQKSLRNYE